MAKRTVFFAGFALVGLGAVVALMGNRSPSAAASAPNGAHDTHAPTLERDDEADRTAMPVSNNNVPTSLVEEYMSRSAPNLAAVGWLRTHLQRARATIGVSFEETVDCRGQACKAVLDIAPADASRLSSLPVPADVELVYRMELRDVPQLVIFSTVRGAHFADILRELRP